MGLFLLFGFLLALAPGLCLAAGAGRQNFRYAAPLTSEDGAEYTSVRLSPEIIGKLRNDLADLLIVSEDRPVPYFLNSYSIAQSASVKTYELALSDSYRKDSFQYLDYKFPAEPLMDIVATSVNMTASSQFVKDITLYGSYDGMNWSFIKDDSIHQVESSRKLSVPLLPGEKYTHYRFRVSGGQEPIDFGRVWLEYSVDIVSKDFFIETLTPAVTVAQDGKTTVAVLNGLRNLVLSEIEIETDSMFKRNVYVNGVAHTLYNLTFGSDRYRDLVIPMNRYQCASDRLELRIDNGDDSPIHLESVSVSYLTYDMVFQNTQTPAVLYFGNTEIAGPLQYDIIRYKEYILAQGYGKADISEISALPVEPPEELNIPDYTALFNVTIIAAAVLLAGLLIARLKKVR
jgi:hypothetical protein